MPAASREVLVGVGKHIPAHNVLVVKLVNSRVSGIVSSVVGQLIPGAHMMLPGLWMLALPLAEL
jgi:hypothetical protein